MLFRNLTLFRFAPSLRSSLETLHDRLSEHTLRPLGPLELATRGFVSPFGPGHDALSRRIGDRILLTLGGHDKIMPAAVLNHELIKKIDALRQREGRNPGAKERKRLRDEVIMDLLPRAFSRPSMTAAYIDLAKGWLVVDTSSRKVADAVVSAIREALGSFPALPVNAESSPRATMTAWIAGQGIPACYTLGDEFELIEPVDSGASGKFKHQETGTEEIQTHLQAGKQCSRLGLVFNDRLSFVLDETMTVRKLRFLELATADLEKTDRDSIEAEVDASFTLMTSELGLLLEQLERDFSLIMPDQVLTVAPIAGNEEALLTAAAQGQGNTDYAGGRAGRVPVVREVECGSCGGYGYTEAVSLAWSESEFREFSCPSCCGDGFVEVAE